MNGAPQEALLQLFISFINAPENGKRGEVKEFSADAKPFNKRRSKN